MATPPKIAATIIIPIEQTEIFKQRLNNIMFNKELTTKWKRHTVVMGDSISEIANKYATTTDIIKTTNKLESDIIKINQILTIPNTMNIVDIKNNDYRISSKVSQDKIPGPKITIHKVKAGDTVTIIANKYNVTLGQIEFWNNINARKKLKENDEIILWTKKKQSNKTTTYKIKPGDTLGGIAQKHSQSIKQLKAKNGLISDLVKINQILKV